MREQKPWIRWGLLVALVALWIGLFIAIPAVTIAGDFFPIYHAAGLVLHGRSPYSLAAVHELQQLWPTPHAATGYSYPLPLALLLVPLGALPLLAAVIIWLAISTASAAAVLRLRPDWPDAPLLVLLFMPCFDALRARQVSLLFFGLIVLLLLGMRARRAWLIGAAIALLPIKPQIGLLFALYGLVWAWRKDRRALLWALGLGALVWGGSLALQPTWPQEWIAGLSRYTAVNQSITLLPWSLVLLLVTWHLPWPARIAAAQVALFPLVGVYTLLPLLLVWLAIGGRRALVGAAISWAYLPFITSSSAAIVYATMIVPVIVIGYLDRRTMLRARAAAGAAASALG